MIYNKEIDNGEERAEETFPATLNERSNYRSYPTKGDEQGTGDQGSGTTGRSDSPVQGLKFSKTKAPVSISWY
jgi:hypothetical protein